MYSCLVRVVVSLCCAAPFAMLQLHPPDKLHRAAFSTFLVVLGARCLLIQRKASTIFFIAAPNSSLPRCCCCHCYCCFCCCYCCSRIPCPGWELKTKAKQTKAERPYLNNARQQCVLLAYIYMVYIYIHSSITVHPSDEVNKRVDSNICIYVFFVLNFA